MRRRLLRHRRARFAIVLVGLLVAAMFAVAAWVVIVGTPFDAEHERWVSFATAQAATYEAQPRPGATARAASPTRTPISPAPAAALPALPPGAAAGLAVGPGQEAPPTAAPHPSAATLPASSPDPPPALAPFRATDVVTAEQPVNLRAGPGTTFPILRTVAPGIELAATGAEQATDGQAWRQFTLASGQSGWIRGDLVTPLQP